MTNEPLPNVPNGRDLVSYRLRSEGESPRKKWVAVMEYPDCTREFDGATWTVVADKREAQRT